MLGHLAAALLLACAPVMAEDPTEPAGAPAAQAAPAAPKYVRPESWCRYLYDVRKYSWRNCLTAPAVPTLLLNEASDAADERQGRVAELAERLKKCETADDVRAVLDGAAAALSPPMTERTFSAWLEKRDLDEVQLKLRMALPRLKPRQPLPVVDVAAVATEPEGPDAFERLLARFETLDHALSRLTSPRPLSGSARPSAETDLPLPKLLEPLTEVRFTTAAAIAAAEAADSPLRRRIRELLRPNREVSPFAAAARAAATLPAVDRHAACADFYEFSCGPWAATHHGKPWSRRDEAAALTEARLREALPAAGGPAGAFYAACVREPADGPGLQALRAELARLDALRATALVAEEAARLRQAGVRVLLDVAAVPDPDNPSVGSALLSVETRPRPAASLRARAAGAFERFGASPSVAAADAEAVVALESILADETPAPEKPARLRLDEAARAAAPFPLRRYLASLGAPPVDEALVSDPRALRRLGQALKSQTPARWSAYLRWRLIEAKAWLLPGALGAGVAAEGAPRWRLCARAAARLLPQTAGRAYAERYLSAHDRNQAAQLANAVRLAVEARVREAAWLSPATQQEALRKLGAATIKAGYPDQAADAGVDELACADALACESALQLAALRRRVARVGQPVERSRWSVSPASAALAADWTLDELVVPAAALQRPFFSGAARPSDNYGALGAAIGYELGRGVAGDGRRYDADGRAREWWPAYDAARLQARAQCLPAGGAVDDLAVRAAYDALRGQSAPGADPGAALDEDSAQRFFLSYAVSRCGGTEGPAVNAVLANMPEFAAAFSCPAAAPMASAPRCQVW